MVATAMVFVARRADDRHQFGIGSCAARESRTLFDRNHSVLDIPTEATTFSISAPSEGRCSRPTGRVEDRDGTQEYRVDLIRRSVAMLRV